MNYQTVVDEETSLLSDLLLPCLCHSIKKKRREERRGAMGGQGTEEGFKKRDQVWVRGQNIENVMKKRRIKSDRR